MGVLVNSNLKNPISTYPLIYISTHPNAPHSFTFPSLLLPVQVQMLQVSSVSQVAPGNLVSPPTLKIIIFFIYEEEEKIIENSVLHFHISINSTVHRQQTDRETLRETESHADRSDKDKEKGVKKAEKLCDKKYRMKFFKISFLGAELHYESLCLSVWLYVCLSVCRSHIFFENLIFHFLYILQIYL